MDKHLKSFYCNLHILMFNFCPLMFNLSFEQPQSSFPLLKPSKTNIMLKIAEEKLYHLHNFSHNMAHSYCVIGPRNNLFWVISILEGLDFVMIMHIITDQIRLHSVQLSLQIHINIVTAVGSFQIFEVINVLVFIMPYLS